MNNVKRIPLTLKEASDWAAEGFEVECFGIVQPVEHKKAKRVHVNKQTHDNTRLALSVEGKPPSMGRAGAVWPKLNKALWSKDATVIYPKAKILEELKRLGEKKPTNMASYLIHTAKVLRVVEEK